MGTFIEVTSSDRRAPGIVFDEFKRIERLLSKYDSQSEIFRLNQQGRLQASPETYDLIKRSKELSRVTAGAFDITVGPLMDIWGFADRDFQIPSRAQIRRALALVGSDKIILQDADNVVKLKIPGMKLDLGGIAKGFAIDRAVARLKSSGITSCLINAGGQVFCLGSKSGVPWRVAIQDPRNNDFRGYLELVDRTIATSGDYNQYFIRDNRRYSHIIDPRSGYPADSGVVSVTVISDQGALADGLSTAIFVLGKDKARLLVNDFPGTEVKVIEEKDLVFKGKNIER
ncbi:MAG: FAD:protein FMN transferase [Candidatus Omnitrophica bacterium]|nr:FAD:protein FMN transferase [Candidatus Omnitrophota bacterium]